MSIHNYSGTGFLRNKSRITKILAIENQQVKGKFDNWLVLFLIFAILEGVFYDFLTPLVTERNLLIFHLTPFNLYPTDLFLVPMSFVLLLFTQPVAINSEKPKRNYLLVLWWVMCATASVIGILNRNNYISADIRNFVVRSILAFTIYRLGLESNLHLVVERVVKVSAVVALFLVGFKLVLLMGFNLLNIHLSSWGTYALLLPYCVLIMRILRLEKPSLRILLVTLLISIGILQAFWKPVVFGFLIVPMLALLFPLYFDDSLKKISLFRKLQRILPAIIIIAIFSALFLTTNSDYYFRLFRYSYLKEGFVIQDYSGNRFGIWGQAINEWYQKPIFGYGFGSLLRGYLLLSGTGIYTYFDQLYFHNILIQILYQFGILGLLIVILLIVRWFSLVWRTIRLLPPWALVSYSGIVLFCILTMIVSLVGEALRYSPAGFLFWSALGLEAAFAAKIESITTGELLESK